MTTIHLQTIIHVPIEKVFDLARSIDLHLQTTSSTNERVIAGRSSGLIELNETVTWRAKHLGIYQNLTSQITAMEPPYMFKDKMLRGAFSFMEHTHRFRSIPEGTIMTDEFTFAAPLGILGSLVEKIFLKKYMTRFIENRNNEQKKVAENK